MNYNCRILDGIQDDKIFLSKCDQAFPKNILREYRSQIREFCETFEVYISSFYMTTRHVSCWRDNLLSSAKYSYHISSPKFTHILSHWLVKWKGWGRKSLSVVLGYWFTEPGIVFTRRGNSYASAQILFYLEEAETADTETWCLDSQGDPSLSFGLKQSMGRTEVFISDSRPRGFATKKDRPRNHKAGEADHAPTSSNEGKDLHTSHTFQDSTQAISNPLLKTILSHSHPPNLSEILSASRFSKLTFPKRFIHRNSV